MHRPADMRGPVLTGFLALAGAIAIIGPGHAGSPPAGAQQRPGPGGPPPGGTGRRHTVEQAPEQLILYEASEAPITDPVVTIAIEGDERVIAANAIAAHKTGPFPNPDNPNAIAPQQVLARIPAAPSADDLGAPQPVREPGWAINGVKFDPGAAEFWLGDPALGWVYEPLSGAIALGLDQNHAHVQPTGHYHYHGLPMLLLQELGVGSDRHSPIVGWAADGFPIYALFGYADGTAERVTALTSSWRLKAGTRPGGDAAPGGTWDGTFTQDYEFIAGAGDLDECNGRITVTPEFPDGTYAYFLTDGFPVIPRCLRGELSADYLRFGRARPAPR